MHERFDGQCKARANEVGARVIYFNVLEDGFLVLLAVYAKAEQTNIAVQTVKGAKRGFEKD